MLEKGGVLMQLAPFTQLSICNEFKLSSICYKFKLPLSDISRVITARPFRDAQGSEECSDSILHIMSCLHL
jgi:hypothetical protein